MGKAGKNCAFFGAEKGSSSGVHEMDMTNAVQKKSTISSAQFL